MSDETVTRADIASAIHREIGLSRVESSGIVEAIVEEISTALKHEESVKISSFASFEVKAKKGRVGRNPKTKSEAVISPRRVVSFHASLVLKENINYKLKRNQF